MKKINDRWVDVNNNSWLCEYVTKTQAEEMSKTLSDCSDCSDCHDCSNCSNFRDCSNCSNCSNCSDCSNCRNCRNCSNCSDCSYFRDCSNCSNCSDCSNCSNCRNCSNCYDCSYFRDCSNCSNCSNCCGFKNNPQCYVSDKIGSRLKQTTFYWDKEKVIVVCGCFIGDLDAFREQIKKTHGNNKYAKEYMTEIKKVKMLMGIK